MKYQKKEIKQGITTHLISHDKFKTNLLSVFVTVPLDRKTVTYNASLVAVLRRGSKQMPTQEAISKKLEEMYGASFDCGIDKIGDNQILKFYFESVKDEYLPQSENILKESLDTLLQIVFDPYLPNGMFKEEYVTGEKENIRHIIEGKIDNKAQYAMNRCIEEMYPDDPYGLYKFGYVEDLEEITPETLYRHYQQLMKEAKIDIFVSGDLPEELTTWIEENKQIQNLDKRDPKYIVNNETTVKEKEEKEVQTVIDTMDISQGKLVIGLDIKSKQENLRFPALVYDAILGGTPNSKLFQNVREKASLAYSASSTYIRQKSNIYIRAGIEADNFEKAVEIIKEQLEQMKQGNFSEDDMKNAKTSIISSIQTIDEEQDTEIIYLFGQELSQIQLPVEEYQKQIESVTKEQIMEVAKNITIHTIYLLKGQEGEN